MVLAKDSPEGHSVTVVRVKPTQDICGACYYTCRGSFKDSKQNEVIDAMQSHEHVKEKLLVWDWCVARTLPLICRPTDFDSVGSFHGQELC